MIRVITEDWMHGALQDGTLNVVCPCLLLAAQDKLGVQLDSLERFLHADWRFPQAMPKMAQLWHVFDAKHREHIDETTMKFKCLASELLGLYTLLRHFIVVTISSDQASRDAMSAELAAFKETCRVVDLTKRLMDGHANQRHADILINKLQLTIDKSIELHIACYGLHRILPKHHRLQHIPEQIRRNKVVLDAFIVERLHLVMKDILNSVRNTRQYEATMLRGACMKHMEALQDHIFHDLIGTVTSHPALPGTLLAKRVHFCGLTVSVKDLVFLGNLVGRVQICGEEMGSCFVVVEWFRAIAPVIGGRKWRSNGDATTWAAEHIEQVLVWHEDGAGIIILAD